MKWGDSAYLYDRPMPRIRPAQNHENATPAPGNESEGSRAAEEVSVRRVLGPFLEGQRRRLVLLSTTAALGGFAEAAVLVLISRIAFALAAEGDQRSHVTVDLGPIHAVLSLPFLIGLAAALIALRLTLNIWQARLSARASTSVLSRIRKRLVALYLGASWSLQSEEREGRLQELLTTYAVNASTSVLYLANGAVAVFNLSAFILTALAVNPAGAVVVSVTALLLAAMLRPIRAAVRRRSRRSAEANLTLATSLTELASTTQEVRIFEVEQQVRRRLDAQTDVAAEEQYRTSVLGQVTPAFYQSMALFLVVVVLAVAYAVDFTSLASLGAVILIMLRSLTYGQGAQSSLQALHTSAPYLDTLQAEEDRYRAATIERGGDPIDTIGDLAFDDVSFEYEPGQPVLCDLDFDVHRGEIIGIVGPSGAGKSTLVQLLLRLREPTKGRLLVDGRDVRGLTIDDWYHHVTFVPQDAHLFAGTIADNIRFFREDVPDTAVEKAARQAHLHDDIVARPLGYDTPIGERGGHLSGGQKQRLCIARALLEQPSIIVLDEPTSSLDARSEALMRETISGLVPQMTVFVIAHRPSTLSMCDRIMVIHGGGLQGFDEPAQLEEDNPFYRDVLKLSGMR